jgi:predicted transcriptional regulator
MDLFDLANSVRLGDPVEEIAGFLCRSRREVRDKIAELEQTGELEKRVAETAKGAKD